MLPAGQPTANPVSRGTEASARGQHTTSPDAEKAKIRMRFSGDVWRHLLHPALLPDDPGPLPGSAPRTPAALLLGGKSGRAADRAALQQGPVVPSVYRQCPPGPLLLLSALSEANGL